MGATKLDEGARATAREIDLPKIMVKRDFRRWAVGVANAQRCLRSKEVKGTLDIALTLFRGGVSRW